MGQQLSFGDTGCIYTPQTLYYPEYEQFCEFYYLDSAAACCVVHAADVLTYWLCGQNYS